MKKVILTFLTAAMLLVFSATVLAQDIQVSSNGKTTKYTGKVYSIRINGETVKTDVEALLINDRAMVPVRAVFEMMGSVVSWNASAKIMTIKYKDQTVELKQDSTSAKINNKAVTLDEAPKMVNNTRLVMPANILSKYLGLNVGWYPAEGFISIDYNKTYGLKVNGTALATDVDVSLLNGQPMVPVRAVFEKLGGTVVWDASKKLMTVKYKDKSIELNQDNTTVKVNTDILVMDTAARMIDNNRLVIPASFLSSALGMNVEWTLDGTVVSIDDSGKGNAQPPVSGPQSGGQPAAGNPSSGTDNTQPAVTAPDDNKAYSLRINGDAVSADIEIKALNGHPMVPVRAVFEKLEGVVSWNAASKTMTIKYKNKTIVLKQDDRNAKVDNNSVVLEEAPKMVNNNRLVMPVGFLSGQLGMKVELLTGEGILSIDNTDVYSLKINDELVKTDVPPTIINDRTMVPVRAVFEKLGGTVSWDAAAQKMSVQLEDSSIELVLGGDTAIINGEKVQLDEKVQMVKDRLMLPVTFMRDKLGMELGWYPEQKLVTLVTTGVVKSITYTKGASGDTVKISMDKYSGSNVFRLTQPDRLVIDLAKTKGPEKETKSDVTGSFFSGIRYREFDANVTRVVLDLNEQLIQYQITEDKSSLTISLKKSSNINLAYENSFDRVWFSLKGAKLTEGDEDLKKLYTEKYDATGKIYTVTFPSAQAELGTGVFDINDGQLNFVEVTKDEKAKTTSMTFNAKDKFVYEIITRPETGDTAITILKPASKEDRLVVIDAGHGGRDPGAVYRGTYEKTLNLDIALKLNEALKAKGIKTYMIRSDDIYVGLYERAYIANDLNAALFICVHNNAVDDVNVGGTMSLYYPSPAKEGSISGKQYAELVQSKLLEKIKTTNRKTEERPRLVVLKATKMPAVLTEVAFMTNKKDMDNLLTDSFRQSAADGIANAVEEALKYIK